MKTFPVLSKIALSLLTIILLASCGGSKPAEDSASADSIVVDDVEEVPVETASVDSTAGTPYTGTFEYSEPWEGGYIYYKLELVQKGKNVEGKFNAGNYLASNGSGYTAPDALMEGNVQGWIEMEEGKEYMSVQLDAKKDEQLEEGAPSLKELMNFPDMEVEVNAVIWKLQMDNGVLKSSNGQMKDDQLIWLAWERLEGE